MIDIDDTKRAYVLFVQVVVQIGPMFESVPQGYAPVSHHGESRPEVPEFWHYHYVILHSICVNQERRCHQCKQHRQEKQFLVKSEIVVGFNVGRAANPE